MVKKLPVKLNDSVKTSAEIFLDNLISKAKSPIRRKCLYDVKKACDYLFDGPYKGRETNIPNSAVAGYLKSVGLKPSAPQSISRDKHGIKKYLDLRRLEFNKEKVAYEPNEQNASLTKFTSAVDELLSRKKLELASDIITMQELIKKLEQENNDLRSILTNSPKIIYQKDGEDNNEEEKEPCNILDKAKRARLIDNIFVRLSLDYNLKFNREGMFTAEDKIVWDQETMLFLSEALQYDDYDDLIELIS